MTQRWFSENDYNIFYYFLKLSFVVKYSLWSNTWRFKIIEFFKVLQMGQLLNSHLDVFRDTWYVTYDGAKIVPSLVLNIIQMSVDPNIVYF